MGTLLNRLSPGTGVSCVAGVLLVASLFLPWYGVELGGRRLFDESGWAALATVDVVLLVMALAAVALAAGQLAGARLPRSANRGAALATLGALATILVAIVPPQTPGSGREGGWLLALAAAAAMGVGGMMEASGVRSGALVGRWERIPGWFRGGAVVAVVLLSAASVALVLVGYGLHCSGDDGVLEYPSAAGAAEVSFCRALDEQPDGVSATTRSLAVAWTFTPVVLVVGATGLLLGGAFRAAGRRRLWRGAMAAAALAVLIAILPVLAL